MQNTTRTGATLTAPTEHLHNVLNTLPYTASLQRTVFKTQFYSAVDHILLDR